MLQPMPQTNTPNTSDWDYTLYENRLRTFNSGWPCTFITPHQMAKAGFFYTNKKDRVKCMFCSKELDLWEPNDDPVIEHKQASPRCPFFIKSQAYDICGPFESNNPLLTSNKHVIKVRQFLTTMSVVPNMVVPPINKGLTTIESRLKSFELFKHKRKLHQDIFTLCESGLFYIGDGHNDKMLCFCCNQGLKDWEPKDDPWLEHARWSPSCCYMLLMKGKHFVEKAIRGVSDYPQETVELNTNSEISKFVATKIKREYCDDGIEEDSIICKICWKEPVKVIFIPCGHVISCIQCAVSLEQCAICRQTLNSIMRVYIYNDKQHKNNHRPINSASSLTSIEHVDPMLCKVCKKEEMAVTFLPCRHIFTCSGCSDVMKKCPVCFVPFFAILQVFL